MLIGWPVIGQKGNDMNINFWPLLIAAAMGITLGVWKLVEIILWVFAHLSWN